MYTIFLLLVYSHDSHGYGYDAGTDQGACGKPYRTSRMHQPPCDLAKQTFCTSAGTMYPWHAVRRFIRENQGLMRRMYGDEKHLAVLRAELQDNDVDGGGDAFAFPRGDEDLFSNGDYNIRFAKQDRDFENELYEESETPRYLQDTRDEIIMNTKFVYGQDPKMQIKLKDLAQPPRFRPTTQKTDQVTEASTPNSNRTLHENSTEIANETEENTTETTTEEATILADHDDGEDVDTTTEYVPETTTQQKKEHVGEVLFQDVENNNRPQVTAGHMNYKLKGVNACPVKEEVVAPFWANNTRGEVLALLNLYPFEQYVHWEKCTFEHRQMYCREGCRCEQQYRLHRLLAYDPNNECRGIFSDWFKFPSCCVCKCYDMPAEFRVTSRSPRSREDKSLPQWLKKKNLEH